MNKEAGLSLHSDLFGHAIRAAEKDVLAYIRGGEFEGSVGEFKFRVKRAHESREGHSGHNFVGFLDVINPDGTITPYVIKPRPMMYRERMHNATASKIEGYAPRQHAPIGNWVVEERIFGLELDELEQKLESDPEFLDRYVSSVFQLIWRCSNRSFRLQDVTFINGHNCMVDPETLRIRLLEQSNIFYYPHYGSSELITEQLFDELSPVTIRPMNIDYAFRLLRLFFQVMNPREFFLRRRKIRPTHPDYKGLYDLVLKRELPIEVAEDGTIFYYGSGFTRTFSKDMIEAIIRSDKRRFEQVFLSGNYVVDITDPKDSRYNPVILPDNVFI